MLRQTTMSRALVFAMTVVVGVFAALLAAPTHTTAVHTPPLNPSNLGNVVVDGPLDCPSGWCVLAQACFGYDSDRSFVSGTARLNVTLAQPSDAVDVRIYLYSDDDGAWEYSGDEDRSCLDRIANKRAANWEQLSSGDGGFDVRTTASKPTWTMQPVSIHEHVKPRFWYVVAANCKPNGFKFQRYQLTAHDIASYHERQCGEDDGVDTKRIAIIVVVVLLLLCMLSTTVYCCCCRKKKKNFDLTPSGKSNIDEEDEADEMDALKGGRSSMDGGGGGSNGAARSTNYDLDNNDDIDDLEEITEALQATRGDDRGLNLEEVQLR